MNCLSAVWLCVCVFYGLGLGWDFEVGWLVTGVNGDLERMF